MKREVFLYMEPRKGTYGNHSEFAQCSTCMMWTGAKHNTCTIHGKTKVTGDMTCGLYVNGHPMPDEAGHEMDSVTKAESGLEKRDVRCENCGYYEKKNSHCHLFMMLDMDSKVHPKGCCNANIPKNEVITIGVVKERPSAKFFKKA